VTSLKVLASLGSNVQPPILRSRTPPALASK
jgi:hypothetical protein